LVRFIWSGISEATAHWEQAFSIDGGQIWEDQLGHGLDARVIAVRAPGSPC
jgi:hypothetical protein